MGSVSLDAIMKEVYKEVQNAYDEWVAAGEFTKAVIRHIGAAYALADLYDEHSDNNPTSLAYTITEMELFKAYRQCKMKEVK